MTTLLELAERCEAATGPDVGIDEAIARAVAEIPANCRITTPDYSMAAGVVVDNVGRVVGTIKAAEFTASIDAAMTLVPEGTYPMIDCEPGGLDPVEIYRIDNPHGAVGICHRAATPALALCAAALRARASQTTADDGDER